MQNKIKFKKFKSKTFLDNPESSRFELEKDNSKPKKQKKKPVITKKTQKAASKGQPKKETKKTVITKKVQKIISKTQLKKETAKRPSLSASLHKQNQTKKTALALAKATQKDHNIFQFIFLKNYELTKKMIDHQLELHSIFWKT